MKILFFGYLDSPLVLFLKNSGEDVITTNEKFDLNYIQQNNYDFLISYGYRHIIRKEILEKFPKKSVNLHVSYLPWNRGADPNLWSFVDNTPKGVTVHYIDEGLDTGDILFQKNIEFEPCDTLKTSYDKLHREIQHIFMTNWPEIRTGHCPSYPQIGSGSLHKSSLGRDIYARLPSGFDTPITTIMKLGHALLG